MTAVASLHAGRPRRRLDRATLLSLATLGALTLAVILVPAFARDDPLVIRDVLRLRLLPPGTRDVDGGFHLLGTDNFGRDLFVRMMLGGRVSLAVGVVGSLLAGGAGKLLGAIAAWRGGVVDRLTMGIADALLAIPRLVLLLVCAALWRPGLATVLVVLVATGWIRHGCTRRRSVTTSSA